MFDRWKRISNRAVVGILIIIALFAIAPSLLLELLAPQPSFLEWFEGLLLNFGTEMLGAALTFLLLYLWVERRDRLLEIEAEEKATKKRLLQQMASQDNETALSAVKELSWRGWLRDGTLEEAQLAKANLAGADLSFTNLRGTHLSGANLKSVDLTASDLSNAYLDWADLTGAKLTGAVLINVSLWRANLSQTINLSAKQLSSVRLLRGAKLPDGKIYDGRYQLAEDILKASREGIDPNDSSSLARWYGISIEEYQEGQKGKISEV